MDEDISERKPTILERTRRRIIGEPRDIKEPSIFHKLSLIPILAWIGLGADGLSSSSYGPEEAFRALGEHTYLAIFLAIATAFNSHGCCCLHPSPLHRWFYHRPGDYVLNQCLCDLLPFTTRYDPFLSEKQRQRCKMETAYCNPHNRFGPLPYDSLCDCL